MGFEKEIAIIIPALNPDIRLLDLVEQLHAVFPTIVIVDDGSNAPDDQFNHQPNSKRNDTKRNIGIKNFSMDWMGVGVFRQCAEEYNVIVLRHAVNMGKGQALKTAFNYLLTCPALYTGAVCADSDGQHTAEDIIKCATELFKHKDALILGSRKFDDKSIPFRSCFGNKLTSQILKLLCGITLTDTQTGLRGIPYAAMREFLNVSGERYEYELNMILRANELYLEIREFPISTIYINNNKASHFNPLKDSIKIYSVFGKFIFASISSFILDIALFYLLIRILSGHSNLYIYISTLIARIISSIYNYSINKTKVFKNDFHWVSTFFKYYILCFFQMALSAVSVNYLCSYFGFGELLVKIGVDTVLFLISFYLQREWVFKHKSKRKQEKGAVQ